MASCLKVLAGGNGLHKMMTKTVSSKALVIKVNLAFLSFCLATYATLLLLRPSWPPLAYRQDSAVHVRCSLLHCHNQVEKGVKMKAMLEERRGGEQPLIMPKKNEVKTEKPSFMNDIGRGLRIGTVNMDDEDLSEWKIHGDAIKIRYDKVSDLFEWKHLFPEWIDEEQDNEGYLCPEIPMPEFEKYAAMDMVVAKLPCKYPKPGWGREMHRLQVHLIAAKLAAAKGRSDWFGRSKVVFLSECRPMMELFRCDDLVSREGNWWYYQPQMAWLQHKVSLPIGSCRLALPLWGQGVEEVYDASKIERMTKAVKREAYATVLHSSESYVCGAIALAQTLIQTGTKRDLILLLDKSISGSKREALIAAGWKIRVIKRIRNPRAERNSYNEYNYSKFRLWQLTNYDKIIFIDADIIVLRNIDLLFHFSQMSATGNDGSIFNSGIMVIEPSNCTFRSLMEHRREIVSYNGGDQGFLNEVFVWWHRLPRRVNFLKNFWSNSSLERSLKNQLFGSDPPKLYSIHYLGLKPWLCYRDYDCNWDIPEQHVYASDVAHERWWKVHDSMDKSLQKFCELTPQRKDELKQERQNARKFRLNGGHWRINITDPRRFL